MIYPHRLLRKFGKLSVFRQSCLIILAAVAGAELLTLIFYGMFFADRLLLDLLLTAVIVIIVGFPLALLFIGQQVRLSMMAAELDRAARTDGLTGLTNRRTFFEEAAGVISREKTTRGALLFIDVDHFKSINDTFGHTAGDDVLRGLAEVIRSSIREEDIAARLGGEEFGVFLVDSNQAQAMQVAERIRMNARNDLRVGDIMDRAITVSIGVCMREPGQNLQDILLKADRNLYAAKSRGRDLVVGEDAASGTGRGGANATMAKDRFVGVA